MRHAASPEHLPWFITEPGQIDALMVFAGVFILLSALIGGVLIIRLSYLPVTMVPPLQRAKYEVVATLCLIDILAPGHWFWFAALMLAMINIPDFEGPLQRMAEAVDRFAQRRKINQQVLSRPGSHKDLRQASPQPIPNPEDVA